MKCYLAKLRAQKQNGQVWGVEIDPSKLQRHNQLAVNSLLYKLVGSMKCNHENWLRKEKNKTKTTKFEKFENDKKRVINTNWTSLKRLNPIKMTIFNLYIFDEKGSLIYYKEWLRKKHTSMEKDEVRSAGIKWVFILMFLYVFRV